MFTVGTNVQNTKHRRRKQLDSSHAITRESANKAEDESGQTPGEAFYLWPNSKDTQENLIR